MDPQDYVKIGESIASLSFIGAKKREREEDTCKENQTRIQPKEYTKEVLEMFCKPNYEDGTYCCDNTCKESQTLTKPREDTKGVLEMFCKPNFNGSYCCDNSEKMCDFSTTPECPIFYGEINRKDPLSFFTAYPSRHKFSLEVFQENGQDVNPMERMPKNPLTREDVEYWYKGGYHYGMPHTSKLYSIGKAWYKTNWYKKSDTYVGGFKNGKREGEGTYTYALTGEKYEGGWKDDKREGKGTLFVREQKRYEGEWKNGKMDGKGIRTWSDGDKHDGYFKNGKREGYGTYITSDGGKYEGYWKNGKKEGKGTLTYSSGVKYDGYWKNNNMHGKGTITWPDGVKYDGYWKNGRKDGIGIMTYPDGKKYKEEWKDGERHVITFGKDM